MSYCKRRDKKYVDVWFLFTVGNADNDGRSHFKNYRPTIGRLTNRMNHNANGDAFSDWLKIFTPYVDHLQSVERSLPTVKHLIYLLSHLLEAALLFYCCIGIQLLNLVKSEEQKSNLV